MNALILSKEKKYDDAVVLLQGMGDIVQNYPPALYLMAFVQLQQNQIKQAELNLLTLLNKVPRETTATRLLAEIYMRKKQPAKAVKYLSLIVDENTSDSDLLSLLATAHLQAGNAEKAAQLFEVVAKSRPDDPELKTRLALTRIQSGKTEAGISELRGILKSNPDASRAHILLVLTELQQNNLDGALEAALNLKKTLKDNPLPDNLLGGIWLRKGDMAKARESFAAALAIDGKFVPALLNTAQMELVDKKLTEAISIYSDVIEIDEKNITAMMALSRLAFAAGDRKGGVNWLKMAVVKRPNASKPRLKLIDYYISVKDGSAASNEARDMLQALPDNTLAVDAMGRAQMASNQFASATSSYRKLVSLAPRAPIAHYRLGLALAANKNTDDAQNAFNAAIELVPEFLPAHLGLIGLQIGEKNYDLALTLAEGLREKFPKGALADLTIGDIRLSAGQFVEAAKSFERALKLIPSSHTTIRLFRARMSANQKQDALDGIKMWLQQHAKDHAARFALASYYLGIGDFDQALAEHETLYEFEPENQIVLNNLAWLYDRKGDKRALELAEKALAKDVRSPTVKDTLGWIMLRRGDAERGRQLIEDAAKVLTNNAEVQYHHAYALNSAGETGLARALLQKHLTSNVRPFPEIDDARALLKSIE